MVVIFRGPNKMVVSLWFPSKKASLKQQKTSRPYYPRGMVCKLGAASNKAVKKTSPAASRDEDCSTHNVQQSSMPGLASGEPGFGSG